MNPVRETQVDSTGPVGINAPQRCGLCGGAADPWFRVPVDWRRAKGGGYSLYWCADCQFGQLHPRPTTCEVAKFYEVESYYTHGEGERSEAGRLRWDERLRLRLAWLHDKGADLNPAWLRSNLPVAGRLLDLGCGNGDLLVLARAGGFHACGVEPDPAAREVALSRGLNVVDGTAEALPDQIKSEQFDCVIMSHVLEHCLDPELAVRNAAGLLASSGKLVIETPNNEAAGLRRAGVLWPWLDVPRHLNFFTARSLGAICKSVGLRVQAVEFRGYCRQFMPSWIEMETTIRDLFAGAGATALPSRRRTLSAWWLLLSTLWSRPRFKYDSVRVIASHQ